MMGRGVSSEIGDVMTYFMTYLPTRPSAVLGVKYIGHYCLFDRMCKVKWWWWKIYQSRATPTDVHNLQPVYIVVILNPS